MDRLWLRGGFPDSFLSGGDAESSEYLDFLIRSYLEREVALHGGRIPSGQLRHLWTMLAHGQGGDDRFLVNPGVEMISLPRLLDELLEQR